MFNQSAPYLSGIETLKHDRNGHVSFTRKINALKLGLIIHNHIFREKNSDPNQSHQQIKSNQFI